MRSKIPFAVLISAVSFMLFLGAGCSRRARLTRTLEQANRYFTAGHYDQAEIEYLNALKLRPGDPAAIGQLGIIYFNEGRLGAAVAFLKRGHELAPDNLDVRLKLGQVELAMGDPQKARTGAEFILDHRPADPNAPLLLANASNQAKEITKTRAFLQKLSTVQSAPVQAALGILDVHQHRLDAAEAAFKRAIVLDPKYSQAHAALSGLYRLQNKAKEAGEELRQAAALAPERSMFRLQYAQYLATIGDRKQARAVLEAVTKQVPDYIPAWIQLATLAAEEKHYAESTALLANVRSRDPNNPDAMILTGRNELAEGKPDRAIATFQKMETIYPKAPQVYYQLGTAYAVKGEVNKATESLNRAIQLAPNFPDAILLRASLHIRQAEYGRAIAALKSLVQRDPRVAQAWLLLAGAFRGQGSYGEARAIYDRFQKADPKNPIVRYLIGSLLLQERRPTEAKQAFAEALELAPGYFPALEQIVHIDLAAKRYAEARQRVEDRMKATPKDAGLQLLVANIDVAQGQTAPAEAALKQAIKLQPNLPAPYVMLARLYIQSHRVQSAVASLEDLAAKDPKNAGAQMMIGEIRDQQKNYPAAQAAYEKALAINPDFSAALNNLAYLESAHFHNLDKAFALAQHARELLPNEPHVADTLGWVVFLRGQYPWALTLLQEASSGLPNQAEIAYHLGMAQYMMGQKSAARDSLQRALKMNASFAEAADAKDRLAILEIDPEKMDSAQEALLKKTVAAHPDDPVALSDLAVSYQRRGDVAKAVDALKVALKANPKNPTVVMGLVRAYIAMHDTQQALALAKTARQLAPDDINVVHTLARLAYDTGDCTWAASLLQQAVLKRPGDPGLLFDLALADYGTGDVSDAVTSARQALQANAAFDRAAEARHFLKLTALADHPAEAQAAAAEVAGALKADPKSVPALMAMGTIDEARHAEAEAAKTYEKVLEIRPGFSPAQRRLVILYSANPADDQKAYALGPKAIQAYPQDPALAKAWGIVEYRRGNYGRAVNQLQMAAGQYADDPELRYYLGMAQLQADAPVAGVKTLNEALKLGLKGELAGKARAAIAASQNAAKSK